MITTNPLHRIRFTTTPNKEGLGVWHEHLGPPTAECAGTKVFSPAAPPLTKWLELRWPPNAHQRQRRFVIERRPWFLSAIAEERSPESVAPVKDGRISWRSTAARGAQGFSVAVGPDGNAFIEAGTRSAAGLNYVDYVRCRAADCPSYSDQAVPGSWENTWLLSLTLPWHGIFRMFAENSSAIVEHITEKEPKSSVIIENTKTTYSDETWTACDDSVTETHQYGYQRCLLYQVKDGENPPQDIQKELAVHEDVCIFETNARLNSYTGGEWTNSDGVFRDGLIFKGPSPIPAGAYSNAKQTITVTGNNNPIQVNCISYTSTDVIINDVTSNPDLCNPQKKACI